MPATVVLTKVDRRADGSVYVEFSDGAGFNFPSIEELRLQVREPDNNVDLTKYLCLAYLLGRSPNLTNIASVQGKQFIFDLSNNNPIRIV